MVHVMLGPGSGLEDVPIRGSYYAAAWYASCAGQGTLELIAQRRMPRESALYKRGELVAPQSAGWDALKIQGSPIDVMIAPRLWHHLPAETKYVQKTNRLFIVKGSKSTGMQFVMPWDTHINSPSAVDIPGGYSHAYFAHNMRSELDELVIFGDPPRDGNIRRLLGKHGSIKVTDEGEILAVIHNLKQPPLSLVFTTQEADAAYRESNPGKARNILLEFTL